MTLDYLDTTIILIFIVAVIRASIKSFGDIEGINTFALGRREFSVMALASTIIATWVSGSGFLVALSGTYTNGLYYFIPALGMTLSMIIVALFIVPKMEFFLGKTSVASAMGEIYGLRVKQVTAAAGAIGVSGLIAVQFKVFGNLGSAIFNVHSEWFTILMGAFIIWYSRWGGIKSVVLTDIIQMGAFAISLTFICVMIFHTYYHTDTPSITNIDKFNLSHIFGTYDAKFVDMILLGLYFAIPSLNPAAIQRVSMGFCIEQVKKAWLIAAGVMFFIECCRNLIPILIYQMNPDLKEGEILGFIINTYGTFPMIKGFLIVGIVAMAMSTADSYLNISSVLIANDLWERGMLNISLKKIASDLWKKRKIDLSKIWINEKLNNADKLLNARDLTVLIGTIAIVVALLNNNLLKIILFANSFYMPIVTVPLLFTIFGYKTSEKCVLIAMRFAATIVSCFHISNWLELSPINIDPIIPGMLTNAITLVICTKLFYRDKDNITDKQELI